MELEEAISEFARTRGIHRETLRRWRELEKGDREALLELAMTLKLGQNHLRDVLDWGIEISLRDGVTFASIVHGDKVAPVLHDSRMGRNDKLKHIKESLRRLRYPRLTKIEGEIQKRLRALRMDPRISCVVAPGLEGGLTVALSARGAEDLARLAMEVASLAHETEMRAVFDLLAGSDDANL